MEEELNYATVVFKNGGSPQKENDEDSTIYSTVQSKVPAATGTIKAAGGTVAAGAGEGAAGGGAAGGAAAAGAAAGGAAAGGAAGGAAAAHSRHFVLLLVCLGILCVLLMACIGVIIYICGVMKAQEAVADNVIHLEKKNVIHLEKGNQRLMMEKEILANETEVLTRDRDDLNRTLGVIMTFKNFPVNKFCPDKKCQPCRKSWIPFQDHCYLFYDKPPPWKTWEEARTICRPNADLVVVDSLQEQEFINNHTEYYHDYDHGYWMGLHQIDNKWIWIDGRNETEGHWNQTKVNTGKCAMTFSGNNAAASWGPAWCLMQNKFICEHEALIRTPVT